MAGDFETTYARQNEWLETDGLGGFAMGTVHLARTRRYHAILCHATQPPGGRMVLVNGFDAHVSTPEGDFAISSQAYQPGVIAPDGASRMAGFAAEPWPAWRFQLEDGTVVIQELFMMHGQPAAVLMWRLEEPRPGISLVVRPLLSGRSYHALQIENPVFHFNVERSQHKVVWRPYDGVPAVVAFSNGEYMHEPVWYKNFFYALEAERGMECTEDLAAPGYFRFNLSAGEAALIFCPEGHDYSVAADGNNPAAIATAYRDSERARRGAFATPLHRAGDQYLVERGAGQTVIAGYPWFTDWGRDTFIALRGLCLATGRLEEARSILLPWAALVEGGMLPNRFPEAGPGLEYNSVDAALWFVIAAHEYLAAARLGEGDDATQLLRAACWKILTGYRDGTRHQIHMDADGLIFAGEPGVQLTWMDAKVDDWVVTPRIGKPVEIQALWINALEFVAAWTQELDEIRARAKESFATRFWNAQRECLYDVIDVNGVRGMVDGALRPNQVFAVGGLPFSLVSEERARLVVGALERELLTPLGLRTLEPRDPAYKPIYIGNRRARDGAYHQGTVWAWLLGPFVQAWVRAHGGDTAARRQARERFAEPLLGKLRILGVGHLPEIADGDAPHTPRGCPFQAWSLGELLRMLQWLEEPSPARPSAPAASAPPAAPLTKPSPVAYGNKN